MGVFSVLLKVLILMGRRKVMMLTLTCLIIFLLLVLKLSGAIVKAGFKYGFPAYLLYKFVEYQGEIG